MLLAGEGLAKDPVEAARFFRSAAEQGLPNAEFNLASAYFGGTGVPANYVEAAKWCTIATTRATGAERARYTEACDVLTRFVPPAALAEAKRLAAAWMEELKKVPLSQEN
jgi:TPR repeat protein